MTTKREYAIQLGLAKPGKGRLSAEAHKAIDLAISGGMIFSDGNPSKTVKVETHTETPKIVHPERDNRPVAEPITKVIRSKVRQETVAYVIDNTIRAGGVTVGFSNCGRCGNSISYCQCKEISPPKHTQGIVSLRMPKR